jgi:hypothetical protein
MTNTPRLMPNEPMESYAARVFAYQVMTAVDIALQEEQPADRVNTYFQNMPAGKFKVAHIARLLKVSPATVRKVCKVQLGLQPAAELGRGWWFWKGARS